MSEITFQSLIAAFSSSSSALVSNALLRIHRDRPAPFVPPVLVADGDASVQVADVLVIRAAAAVGKSTLATALSADARIPVLDLSATPVGAGSLSGFVGDLADNSQGVRPIILVDALDEGRLLSGDAGFRAFFESAASTLVKSTRRPRLILLGRPDSANLATRFLREAEEGILIATLDLGYFDQAGARELVAAYADREAQPTSAYRKFASVRDSVVDEYFNAIERAIGLNQGQLWNDAEGRALAGYAPVLAALGVLLARMDNYAAVAQSLRQEGRREAWAVIETVVSQILDRERDKQVKKIEDQVGTTLPSEAYNVQEQLALVTQHVLGMSLMGCGAVKLTDQKHRDAYRRMIDQQLPEHPFVHDGKFRNTVLGSIALASELRRGALDESAFDQLAEVSRQPFLWRSFVRAASEEEIIDGSSVGFLLESFWNDPVRASGNVVFGNFDEETILVSVPGANEFRAMVPISFFGQVTNVQLNAPTLNVRFLGRRVKSQAAQFVIKGTLQAVGSAITCGSASFQAETLILDGSVWLSAQSIEQAPGTVRLVPGTTVGWGGAILTRRPFREQTSTIEDPHKANVTEGLEGLLSECVRRGVPSTLILFSDYGIPDVRGAGPLLWIRNKHADAFKLLVKQLVINNLATTSGYSSRGSEAKVTLHVSVTWEMLLRDLKKVSEDPSAQTQYGQMLLPIKAKTG